MYVWVIFPHNSLGYIFYSVLAVFVRQPHRNPPPSLFAGIGWLRSSTSHLSPSFFLPPNVSLSSRIDGNRTQGKVWTIGEMSKPNWSSTPFVSIPLLLFCIILRSFFKVAQYEAAFMVVPADINSIKKTPILFQKHSSHNF